MDDEAAAKFTGSHLNVDEFLNEATESFDLNSILQSLISWKMKNSYMMSTVLKEQTDAVISIAEEVQGLYQKIESLQCPISQLSEVIRSLKIRVNEMVCKFGQQADCNDHLNTLMYNMLTMKCYNTVIKQTELLVQKYYTTSGKDYEVLERITCQYAFHNQILALLCILPREMDVEKPILVALKDNLLLEFERKNVTALRRVIHVYVLLKKLDNLVEIISEDIMRPMLKPILNEEYLHKLKGSLRAVYDSALNVLTEKLEVLLTSNIFVEVKNFNVVLDCYWRVVDKLLKDNLVSITAAGHADIFFDNFKETCQFLQAISKMCGNENLLKENSSFTSHLKRFNLLVYYEIRHQEVSSTLESAIQQNLIFDQEFCTTTNNEGVINLKLQVSISFYVQLLYLFHHKVFLPILSDQFLKSSLLLTSRYIHWINEVLDQNETYQLELQKRILVCFLCDIATFKTKIGFDTTDESSIETCLFSVDESAKEHLKEVININNRKFSEQFDRVKKILITIIKLEVMSSLQCVMAIPRLYRRTNKNAATQHSAYVDEAVLPIKNLHTYFISKEPVLTQDHIVTLDELISAIAECYLGLVKEVLLSVCKTEKSLRRLKNRNAPVTDDTKLDCNSDEYKIRLQIKLDVACFVKELMKFTLQNGERSLKTLLHEASD